jgi:hypothetical protein
MRATSAGRPIAPSVAGVSSTWIGRSGAGKVATCRTPVSSSIRQISDADAAAVRVRGGHMGVAGELVRQVLQGGGVTDLLDGENVRVQRGDRIGQRGEFGILGRVDGRAAVERPGSGEVLHIPRSDPHHHSTRLPRLASSSCRSQSRDPICAVNSRDCRPEFTMTSLPSTRYAATAGRRTARRAATRVRSRAER